MSELTICNYCTLRGIRAEAERRGKVVTLRRGWRGGTDVLVHDKNAKPDRERDFQAWLMEVSDRCCC